MDPAIILFSIRIISAILLILFAGLIGWWIYKDTKVTAAAMNEREQMYGQFQVIQSVESGPEVDTLYPLMVISTIGRASSNLIVLDDAFVSAQHAMVTLRSGQWWLEDLGSRNGTVINGIAVEEPIVISSGDVITIGNTSLKLQLDVTGADQEE